MCVTRSMAAVTSTFAAYAITRTRDAESLPNGYRTLLPSGGGATLAGHREEATK
jgi:hypothetical protein